MRQFLTLAACLLATAAVSFADTPALRATASADSTEVHPDSVFEVTLSLQNLTGAVEKIKVPDAGWDHLWKSSNWRVSWDATDSEQGTDSVIEITPYQTYVFPNALKMYVDQSVTQAHVDFRMGFKTSVFGKTAWSNSITLDVIQ
jgi:hypothetical protein